MIETMEFRKGIFFLRLVGNVRENESDGLIFKLKELIEEQGIKYIVLNLSNVLFIDSKTIEQLGELSEILWQMGGCFVLCGASDEIKGDIQRKHCLFHVLNSEDELKVFQMIQV